MDIYDKRIAILFEKLNEKKAALIVSAGTLILRNGDVYHKFRVSSDFYYLTGLQEPDLVAIFIKNENSIKKILIILDPPESKRKWDSSWALRKNSIEIQKYDEIISWDESLKITEIMKEACEDVVSFIGFHHPQIAAHLPQQYNLINIQPLIAGLRLFKSAEEIETMRLINKFSSSIYQKMYQQPKNQWKNEIDIEGFWLAEGCALGLKSQAYPPIIAGGLRACCLHYHENDQSLASESVVLIDAGYELNNYASDITRMLFLKKPDGLLKSIYHLVLETQNKIISSVAPGVTLLELQEKTQHLLGQGLLDLNIAQGSLEKVIQEDLKKYYPHSIGHHLGLDVHDGFGVPRLKDMPLEENMVITIEPGLYFEEYGWGIRIEDNILVTSSGFENITTAPKTLDEIL